MVDDAPHTDELRLTAALLELEGAADWPPGAVPRFGEFVRTAPELELYRANPLAYASRTGVPLDEAVDLFLHAAKRGLLALHWELVCPGCGAAVKSLSHLRDVRGNFYCFICAGERQVTLDDCMQVTFTVSRELRALAYHQPEQLPLEARILDCLLSRYIDLEGGEQWVAFIRKHSKAAEIVPPRSRREVTTEITAGLLLGFVVDVHGFKKNVSAGSAPAARLEFVFADGKLTTTWPSAQSGAVTIAIENRDPEPLPIFMFNPVSIPKFAPRSRAFTGKMLLQSGTYRELFQDELLDGAAAIAIRDVTVLFTDLRGSTSLYGRVGDLRAYDLVREHFQCLARVIDRLGGVWIKTIGDAVMASFAEPVAAVRAARAMHDELAVLGARIADGELVLKIGVHHGPVIAVTMNRALDYFGQTVNVAARVQGLSRGGELCVTDEVLESPGVAEAVAGLPIESFDATPRGVSSPMKIHRIRLS